MDGDNLQFERILLNLKRQALELYQCASPASPKQRKAYSAELKLVFRLLHMAMDTTTAPTKRRALNAVYATANCD